MPPDAARASSPTSVPSYRNHLGTAGKRQVKLWILYIPLPPPSLLTASTTPPFGHRLPHGLGCSGDPATLTERGDDPACKTPVGNTYLSQNTTTSEASEQNTVVLRRTRARQTGDEHLSVGGSQRSGEESRAALQVSLY